MQNRKSRNTWNNRQLLPLGTKWSRAKDYRVLPREHTGHRKHLLPTTQEKPLHMDITRWSIWKSIDYILCSQRWRSSISSVQLSRSGVSDSLWSHELQHARPPCPSPTPGVHLNLCPSSRQCHLAISSSVIPFSSCLQSPTASVFSNELTLCMRWPKYWSFSFSIIPSKEIPGLISFRMDWLDHLAVQGTLKSLLHHHSSKASILWCSIQTQLLEKS